MARFSPVTKTSRAHFAHPPVESVASIPGTRQALAGGFTHAPNNPVGNVVAVVLQYS
jgi:hypothetical protein